MVGVCRYVSEFAVIAGLRVSFFPSPYLLSRGTRLPAAYLEDYLYLYCSILVTHNNLQTLPLFRNSLVHDK